MAVPAAPRLRAKIISPGKVRLEWRDVPGATSYDLFRGGARTDPLVQGNERQKVAVQATAGTFTLTFNAEETGPLDFDITAANLATDLNALASIDGIGSVSVTRTAVTGGYDYIVTFDGGALSRSNVSALVADSTALTGGTHTATVTTLTAGGPYDDNVTSPYTENLAEGTQKAYALVARNADGASDLSNIAFLQNGTVAEAGPTPTHALLVARTGLTG